MPRTAMEFENTIIYKLVCNDVEVSEIYVGHTTNFIKRKYNHRSAYFNPNDHNHNYYVYQYIRDHGGFNNWSMIEIEKYPCNNKNEACARERYWMETLHATLNKTIPGRTQGEYYEQNKDVILASCKAYRDNNKERLVEYFRTYNSLNREKRAEYRKKYAEINKEKLTEKRKQYREDNRQTIAQHRQEYYKLNKERLHRRTNCYICDCYSSVKHLKRHEQSQRHQYNVQTYTYEYSYFYEDGTECTEQEYYDSLV